MVCFWLGLALRWQLEELCAGFEIPQENSSERAKKFFRPNPGKGLTGLLQFRPEDRRNCKKVAFATA
jgi:hypothetical protein